MPTREETLNNYEPNSEYPTYYHESNVMEAMSEYARQRAVEFAEWANERFTWVSENKWDGDMDETYTTSELYDLFTKDNPE